MYVRSRRDELKFNGERFSRNNVVTVTEEDSILDAVMGVN